MKVRAQDRIAGERNIAAMMTVLRRQARTWNAPVFTSAPSAPHDPFQVLVGCLLSLRTKDETTGPASGRLFALADSPAALRGLTARRIARAIYPVGFYRTKARTLRRIAAILLERYDGAVPGTLDGLLELPGVGRKTANLVLTQGFGKPGICVDTHVHRITNRWGYVRTRSPNDTELALRDKLPRRYWRRINELLVALGQTICRPISPRCSACPVSGYCARVGVERSR